MILFELKIINPDDPEKHYLIHSSDDEKKVWIAKEDGEGGEFHDWQLFKAIDQFYKDNF